MEYSQQWQDWEDLYKLSSLVGTDEGDQFKNQLKSFSKFLASYDVQFLYNETYLPLFADNFLEFIKYFCLKYPYVKQFFLVAADLQDVKLIIDRYWYLKKEEGKYEVLGTGVDYRKACAVYDNPRYDWVCRNEMKIECSILLGGKYFLFHSLIPECDNSEKVQKNINNALSELEQFIQYCTNEERDSYEDGNKK